MLVLEKYDVVRVHNNRLAIGTSSFSRGENKDDFLASLQQTGFRAFLQSSVAFRPPSHPVWTHRASVTYPQYVPSDPASPAGRLATLNRTEF